MNLIETLPNGVCGNVLSFLPKSHTAQLMVDASNEGKLNLVYLRKYRVKDGSHKQELYNTIAPSVLGSMNYGDTDSPMKITRTKVSVGEKKKLGVKPTFWYVDQEHFFENE
jgi:hypothetical protein|tara:strand:- start:27 stop:359 length:333 start_codon:yes stop_codon:yes gene_type:complete